MAHDMSTMNHVNHVSHKSSAKKEERSALLEHVEEQNSSKVSLLVNSRAVAIVRSLGRIGSHDKYPFRQIIHKKLK